MRNVAVGHEHISFYIGTHNLENRFYMLRALVAYVPVNNNSSPFLEYSAIFKVLDRGLCPDTLVWAVVGICSLILWIKTDRWHLNHFNKSICNRTELHILSVTDRLPQSSPLKTRFLKMRQKRNFVRCLLPFNTVMLLICIKLSIPTWIKLCYIQCLNIKCFPFQGFVNGFNLITK